MRSSSLKLFHRERASERFVSDLLCPCIAAQRAREDGRPGAKRLLAA